MSSEEFFFTDPNDFSGLILDYDYNVYILIYLRRQDLWMESAYKQTVKSLKRRNHIHFYIACQNNIKFLDYYLLINCWKQAFPEAEIIVRIYDRKLFPEGNVILDFLQALGIDMPEAREYKIEANPSLSHLSTLVMRRINEELNLSPQDRWKVVNYLLELDRREGSILKTFFTLEERIKFLEQFRESNEKLFREYFGTKNQFVLSEEEIEFYRQQDQIPREVIERAIEERYQKVLEFMKREGIMAKEKIFPKVNVNYLPEANLEFFRIDVLQANLLNGRLILSGLLLPKNAEGVKLTVKDAEGIKEIQWGLPSPIFGELHPDNPIAKNARFRVDNVVPDLEKPIEVFLNGEKVAEIIIDGSRG
ncbi:hypothetical protein [Archaeoglobus fulgidus]|uniref:hypothetical protein n=1 Tax=Archaeoglobus fulgidus TaxID=2234 RepID=UPI0012DEE008|nr:hypothetical protein [Archaeoglobus fulgidus]